MATTIRATDRPARYPAGSCRRVNAAYTAALARLERRTVSSLAGLIEVRVETSKKAPHRRASARRRYAGWRPNARTPSDSLPRAPPVAGVTAPYQRQPRCRRVAPTTCRHDSRVTAGWTSASAFAERSTATAASAGRLFQRYCAGIRRSPSSRKLGQVGFAGGKVRARRRSRAEVSAIDGFRRLAGMTIAWRAATRGQARRRASVAWSISARRAGRRRRAGLRSARRFRQRGGRAAVSFPRPAAASSRR